jgi:oligopeptide/dipeptide ABC transporter ATP-binding protein
MSTRHKTANGHSLGMGASGAKASGAQVSGACASSMGGSEDDYILRVSNLRTHISSSRGTIKAVDGVNFTIRRGESVALVGESGSGKSMTCFSMMGLMPVRTAKIVEGEIWFDGVNLAGLSDAEMRKYRGNRIALIMQDSLTALNPVLTVGDQVSEPLRTHMGLSKALSRLKAVEVLRSLRVPRPEDRLELYPHQFSGGTRQRIVAAMGLGASPELLIADEPTTALDVTVQAQFIKLIQDLRRERGLSVLWITHDLGLVAQMCDRVNVMYAGRIVESGPVRQIFKSPKHPYTQALLQSVPVLGAKRKRLYQINGQPPELLDLPPGCPFYARCPVKLDVCQNKFPAAQPTESGGQVSCWQAS